MYWVPSNIEGCYDAAEVEVKLNMILMLLVELCRKRKRRFNRMLKTPLSCKIFVSQSTVLLAARCYPNARVLHGLFWRVQYFPSTSLVT